MEVDMNRVDQGIIVAVGVVSLLEWGAAQEGPMPFPVGLSFMVIVWAVVKIREKIRNGRK